MRPRHQEGQICLRGSNWVLRFHKDKIVDGKTVRVRTTETLAAHSDYPYKMDTRSRRSSITRIRRELNEKISRILARVNSRGPAASQSSLDAFIQNSYFPRLEFRLSIPAGNELHIEPTTIQGYHYIYEGYVKDNVIAKKSLSEMTSHDCRQLMESVNQKLSHRRHLRIKNFLSGAFSWAIQEGAYAGTNPMDQIKVGGHTNIPKEHAYTFEEIADMLENLPDPARTVCAVAAFTGLSHSELPGLKWTDYDGETITVNRKITGNFVLAQKRVVGQYIGAPKTTARQAGVPVVTQLQKILAKYKKEYPPAPDGWMFYGKSFKPLNLDNIARREIPKYINGTWVGWHGFRRGVGTRLNDLGVNIKTIQEILRHANVSTTLAFYIQSNEEQTRAGLKKMAKAMAKYDKK